MNRQWRSRISIVCAMIAGLASGGVAADKVWSDTYGEYVDPDAVPETVPVPVKPPQGTGKLKWNETYGEYMPADEKKRVIKSNPRQPLSGEKVWSETYGEYIHKTPESAPADKDAVDPGK